MIRTPYKFSFALLAVLFPLLGQSQTITGTQIVCETANTILHDTTTIGTWSSSNDAIATVGSANGRVHGVLAGNATISYSFTDANGPVLHTVEVTVNPLPVAGTITGNFTVARGATTNLFDAAPGGVWSGCNNAVATISNTGLVLGIANGNALMSYTVTNSCGVARAFANIIVGDCNTATNIATVAGNHTRGNSGDGGAANAAQITTPYAVAADGNGNVYIADYVNNVVRKVNNATGIITTVAGTGVAGYNGDGISAVTAQLNGPAGVTLDGFGNLYIADKLNERIRKVDNSGNITTIAGNGFHGGWQGHSQGNGGPATAASLDYPMTVALDCSGNIYIAEYGSQMVRRINANGYISIFAGTGKGGYNGDGIPATSAWLDHPHGLAIDPQGNVYIADSWNSRIRMVSKATGLISTYAGTGAPAYSGDGGPATSAAIWIPWGITFNACGDLYICDYNNNVVRKVTSGGTMTTFAGTNQRGYTGDGGAATASRIYLPSSLAIDGTGNIYIADFGNNVVRLMGATPYASRMFAAGTTQSINVCEGAPVSIDNIMAIPDASAGKTETWTVAAAPAHGTLSGFNATVAAKNGMIAPEGLTFTAEPGYSGEDEFTIEMNDGTTSAFTTITLVISPLANVGQISVASSPDNGTIILANATADANGIWSSSNTDIATVSETGVVTGITNGMVTISYTLTNGCGAKSATTTVVTDVNVPDGNRIVLFPNPTTGKFTCEFTNWTDGALDLTVTDLTGRVVYTQPVTVTPGLNRAAITLPATLQRPAMFMISLGTRGGSKYQSMKIMLAE